MDRDSIRQRLSHLVGWLARLVVWVPVMDLDLLVLSAVEHQYTELCSVIGLMLMERFPERVVFFQSNPYVHQKHSAQSTEEELSKQPISHLIIESVEQYNGNDCFWIEYS